MQALLTHYLLFISLLYLATEKFKLHDLLMRKGNKILYKLGKCDFCFAFWIAVLTTLIIDAIVWKIDEVDLIMPFVIMGGWLLFNKLDNE